LGNAAIENFETGVSFDIESSLARHIQLSHVPIVEQPNLVLSVRRRLRTPKDLLIIGIRKEDWGGAAIRQEADVGVPALKLPKVYVAQSKECSPILMSF